MALQVVNSVVGPLKEHIAIDDSTLTQLPDRSISVVNIAVLQQPGIDASTNPNYPAANKGWTFYITVAGKIGGAAGVAVEVNDMITCVADSPGGTQAAVGSNYVITQGNLIGAVTNITGGTDNHIVLMSGATGQVIKDGGDQKTAFNVDFETVAANILMDGVAAAGASGKVPDAAHVHPKFLNSLTTYTDTPHTLAATQDVVICNSASAMAINLPAAASSTGVMFFIKNINTGLVTIDANGAETIDGNLTTGLLQWDSVTLYCDGTQWVIL